MRLTPHRHPVNKTALFVGNVVAIERPIHTEKGARKHGSRTDTGGGLLTLAFKCRILWMISRPPHCQSGMRGQVQVSGSACVGRHMPIRHMKFARN
jgi:hypothetical protein